MKKRKEFKIKGYAIVTLLLVLLVMPCVSFAISFSDIHRGDAENTRDGNLNLKTDFNSQHGSIGAECNPKPHHRGPRHHDQPQPTPIPAAAWLLGTGLVGLFGIRRKLQK